MHIAISPACCIKTKKKCDESVHDEFQTHQELDEHVKHFVLHRTLKHEWIPGFKTWFIGGEYNLLPVEENWRRLLEVHWTQSDKKLWCVVGWKKKTLFCDDWCFHGLNLIQFTTAVSDLTLNYWRGFALVLVNLTFFAINFRATRILLCRNSALAILAHHLPRIFLLPSWV